MFVTIFNELWDTFSQLLIGDSKTRDFLLALAYKGCPFIIKVILFFFVLAVLSIDKIIKCLWINGNTCTDLFIFYQWSISFTNIMNRQHICDMSYRVFSSFLQSFLMSLFSFFDFFLLCNLWFLEHLKVFFHIFHFLFKFFLACNLLFLLLIQHDLLLLLLFGV